MDRLQTMVAPHVFQPRGAYDGQKNLYASGPYSFEGYGVFDVLLGTRRQTPPPAPAPGHYRVTLKLVATVRPQQLLNFVRGAETASGGDVLQALNMLNVIIRQASIQTYPHNARSFFTPADRRVLGKGLALCRGYFQSIRPSAGRCLINIDITTGLMWEEGPLLNIVMPFLGKRDVRDLGRLNDREIRALNQYLKGVKVLPAHRPKIADGKPIQRFDTRGADGVVIPETGQTVEAYFHAQYNKQLQYPSACCVWISSRSALPIEQCIVQKGQLYRKKAPSEFMKDVLSYSTKRPDQRLKSIEDGFSVLQYENSDYMRGAGLKISKKPLRVNARALPGARLVYGNNPKLDVQAGAWNLRGLRFIRGAVLKAWAVVLLDVPRFAPQQAENFVRALVQGMQSCGMTVTNPQPPIERVDPNNIRAELIRVGKRAMSSVGEQKPDLLVIITSGSAELYTQVKHFGDITNGVATQHVLADKVSKPNPQYCANGDLVAFFRAGFCSPPVEINVKLSGQNHVPARPSIEWIREKPIIIMGADTSHPGDKDGEKPTISALASSVDADASVYIASTRVQTSRQEIIEDLGEMVENAVAKFQQYQKFVTKQDIVPVRILFYRDGVSEGQFQEVCQREVTAIREAFRRMRMSNPAITFVVVGKRHHVRFFPDRGDADKTGNAPPGLVVDTEIAHPQEWDFYMQSHAGLLGTSRPMHASVVNDDNSMTADQLQGLTFALTHNFARATRSVSIPTPVYYADIACGRAKIHFDPTVQWGSDAASVTSDGQLTLEHYKRAYKQPHGNMQRTMYWM